VYARLDVKTEERGESFYNSRIPKTVEALQKVRDNNDDDVVVLVNVILSDLDDFIC